MEKQKFARCKLVFYIIAKQINKNIYRRANEEQPTLNELSFERNF